MEIVSDAGAFLAVALNEIDRERVVGKTLGCHIVSPEDLPYEIGNALIGMRRKGSLNDREILRALTISQRISVRLVPVEVQAAIKIAVQNLCL